MLAMSWLATLDEIFCVLHEQLGERFRRGVAAPPGVCGVCAGFVQLWRGSRWLVEVSRRTQEPLGSRERSRRHKVSVEGRVCCHWGRSDESNWLWRALQMGDGPGRPVRGFSGVGNTRRGLRGGEGMSSSQRGWNMCAVGVDENLGFWLTIVSEHQLECKYGNRSGLFYFG